ncbi:MAG: sce7726 family protein [Lacrimispora sp.]|uniref:sce7726 family protein n=1 Tax=Lacrimispora sp. TaxID=2719234 RepID=UPI0039E29131
MADSSRAINRVFTRKVICDLLQGKRNDIFDYVVKRYINDPESKNHGELISEIYAHLGKQQRNEYYYMNTLLNKLLDGIHSVNTTTAFSQVHIGHSIADFVMINGEGRVYEIKSDLDNFDRLNDQLSDYYRAFSKVSVLASIHELEKVKEVLSTFGDMGAAVGIYVLSEQSTIFNKERSREPVAFHDMLDHTNIFKLLRKREYESVLFRYFGQVPQSDPVFHFKNCLEYFQRIPIIDAQKLAFQELKKRNKITVEEFGNIRSELKSVIYFSGLIRKLPELNELLQTRYGR